MMNSNRSGVCSECQRLIRHGVDMSGLLVTHPASGVFIDVNDPRWENTFDENVHTVCKGSKMKPEVVISN